MSEHRGKPNVVPFKRDAAYIRARAGEHQRAGRSLEALELTRLSAERAPEDAEAQLALARQYQEIGAYELANRALFALLQRGQNELECFLLLGESFYAMQDPVRADDCVLAAMRLKPEGEQADRAEAMLEDIEEMAQPAAPHGRAMQALMRGVRAMEQGESSRAIRWLSYAMDHGEGDAQGHALRAFAYLGAGEQKAALSDARQAIKRDKNSVQALCAMACALSALKSAVLSAAYLDKAQEKAETSQEVALLCQSACDTGRHDMVIALLRELRPSHPYTPQLLHMMGAAHWNIGQVQQAVQHWGTLRRVDPENLVAAHLHDMARAALPDGDAQEPPEEPVSYLMELPLDACIERLISLHQQVRQGREAAQRALDEQPGFAALLRWAMTIQDADHATRRTILSLLGSLTGDKAEAMLLGALTEPGFAEEERRMVLAALAARGRTGPYHVEMRGHILRVMVQNTAPGGALPPSCERVLQGAVDRLSPRYGDVAQELSALLLPYVCGRNAPDAPLKRPGVWMAALEYVYCLRHELPMQVVRRCRELKVSPRLLKKYADRLIGAIDQTKE